IAALPALRRLKRRDITVPSSWRQRRFRFGWLWSVRLPPAAGFSMLRRRCLAVLISLAAIPSAHAADAPWTAKLESVPRQIIAYATVEPRSVLRLRAGMAGEVAKLTVLPGDTVSAREVLGQLTGPAVETLLSARQAALAGAEATLKGAEQELTIQREKFAGRLTTRGTLTRDVAALSNAQAKLDSARSAL